MKLCFSKSDLELVLSSDYSPGYLIRHPLAFPTGGISAQVDHIIMMNTWKRTEVRT